MDPAQNPDAIKDVEAAPAPAATATAIPVGIPAETTTTTTAAAATTKEPDATAEAIKKAAATVMSLETVDLLALNALFSWVEMIPSAQECQNLNNSAFSGGCTDRFMSYAVAAGAVTGTLNTIVFILDVMKKAPSQAVLSWIALFTFLWWFAAAVVLTFFNPYTTIGVANGYFATWFAFITASMALIKGGMRFHQAADNAYGKLKRSQKPSFFLFLSSTVVMGAAIGPCSPSSSCVDWNAFAIALAVVSQILSLVICFGSKSLPPNVTRMTAQFLILWWTVGTGIVTFGQPFKQAGNGYFASFFSIFLAFVVARVAYDEAQ